MAHDGFEGCKCRSSADESFVVRLACWRRVCEIKKRATCDIEGDMPVVGSPTPLTRGEWVNAMREIESK